MQHVLVAGNHVDQVLLRGGFAGQSADDIVGFIAGEFEDGDAVGLERAANVRHLLHQLGGHLAAVGFVAVVLDFLESLGLDVELANLGDGFRFLITESGRSHVEYGGQVFGREVFAQFAQHVDEDISCRSGKPGFGGHAALPRHGVIGAEDE